MMILPWLLVRALARLLAAIVDDMLGRTSWRWSREAIAWWAVCIVPQVVARWLMWGGGERIPLPANWIPYLFGRALGVYGRRAA